MSIRSTSSLFDDALAVVRRAESECALFERFDELTLPPRTCEPDTHEEFLWARAAAAVIYEHIQREVARVEPLVATYGLAIASGHTGET